VHEVIYGSLIRLRMFYSGKDSLALGLLNSAGMGEMTGSRLGESTHRPSGQAPIQLGYGLYKVKYSPMSCFSSSFWLQCAVIVKISPLNRTFVVLLLFEMFLMHLQ